MTQGTTSCIGYFVTAPSSVADVWIRPRHCCSALRLANQYGRAPLHRSWRVLRTLACQSSEPERPETPQHLANGYPWTTSATTETSTRSGYRRTQRTVSQWWKSQTFRLAGRSRSASAKSEFRFIRLKRTWPATARPPYFGSSGRRRRGQAENGGIQGGRLSAAGPTATAAAPGSTQEPDEPKKRLPTPFSCLAVRRPWRGLRRSCSRSQGSRSASPRAKKDTADAADRNAAGRDQRETPHSGIRKRHKSRLGAPPRLIEWPL